MKEWIGGSDTTFIPCLEGGHWTLVILFSTVKNLKHTHRVVVVDSWKPLGHKQKIGTLAQTVAKAASKAMWDKTVTPKLANNPAIQANDYDCGYFVLENIIWGCADFAGVVEELDGKR
jgi:Ulp1 family protease